MPEVIGKRSMLIWCTASRCLEEELEGALDGLTTYIEGEVHVVV